MKTKGYNTRKLGLVVASLALAGCASLGNTPAQDRSFAAWSACQAAGRIPAGAQLTRVGPDGRYYYTYLDTGTQGIKDCMAEYFRVGRIVSP